MIATFIENLSDLIFSLICHQQSAFLLVKDSKPVLLCPRCIGLEMGFFFAYFVSLIVFEKRSFVINRRTLGLLSVMLGIMVLDFLAGQSGFLHPTQYSRLITGSFGGVSLGLLANSYRYYLTTENKSRVNTTSSFLLTYACCIVMLIVILVTISNRLVITSLLLVLIGINVLAIGYIFIFFIKLRFKLKGD
ncbi:DUF2085 domain-containing protein [candidate division KSB1 bacterium]